MNTTGEEKLVSVVIPFYNRRGYLKEAIQSVIAQTYRPIECIIIDDGSTDDIKTMVDELYKCIDEKFSLRYIYQQNSGSQVARNIGTKASTGGYIQYLDSDDLLYSGKIERQVDYLIEHPECDGVFGDWQIGTLEENETVTAYKDEDFIAQILTERCIANFSFLMRRNIVEKIGDWDVNIKRNQEIDFHLRGVLIGGRFEYLSGDCGLWRSHYDDRIGNTASFTSAIEFYQKWENILKNENLWDEKIQNGIANSYIWFLGKYPNSRNSEFRKLLFEIKRLNPGHPIFNSKKFKLVEKFADQEMAINAWIKIYKRKKRNG